MTKTDTTLALNLRETRLKLSMNQYQFWTKIGVTQSGGSRYESGRHMPKPVRELFRLVYVEKLNLQDINREDWNVIEYLRAEDPEFLKRLQKTAQAHIRKANRK